MPGVEYMKRMPAGDKGDGYEGGVTIINDQKEATK